MPMKANGESRMKVQHCNGILRSFLAGLAGLGVMAGPARAQDEKPSTAAPEPAASLQEVTVTGTRLRETGMNTPTPVTVVTAAQLDLVAPGNVVEAIKQLPQFLGNIDAT